MYGPEGYPVVEVSDRERLARLRMHLIVIDKVSMADAGSLHKIDKVLPTPCGTRR